MDQYLRAPLLGTQELASCRPIEQALRGPRRLRRLLKQLSKSYVRTQRDDLEVEQTCLDYRECSDESLGFAHIITLEDQHDPRAVVRP